jgi:ribonuclease E
LRAALPPTIRAAPTCPPHAVPPVIVARAPETFMTKRMLIDANHPEETRVVILDGSKVEEFDFEAASRRPLKGNIYLAKVTRVEPSLQAAFVEYGGNRQGFLAFAEIHPDYYQIPVADRQALLAEQEAEARRRSEDDIESFEITGPKADAAAEEEDEEDEADSGEETVMAPLVPLDTAPEAESEEAEAHSETPDGEQEEVFVNHGGAPVRREGEPEHDEEDEDEVSENKPDAAAEALNDYHGDADVAAAEALEENEGEIQPVSLEAAAATTEEMANEENEGAIEPVSAEGGEAQALQAGRPPQKWVRKKHYKIQEVIKRRQIILVQAAIAC